MNYSLSFTLRYFPHLYVLSVTVLTLWVAPPKMFCRWNCTHLGILLINSYDRWMYFLVTTAAIICSLFTLNSTWDKTNEQVYSNIKTT